MDFYIYFNQLNLTPDLTAMVEDKMTEISQLASGLGYNSLKLNIDQQINQYKISFELESDIDMIETEKKQGTDFTCTLDIAMEDIKNKVLTKFVLSAS